MEQIKKITGINLIILLIYTMLIQFASQFQFNQQDASFFILGYTIYALIAHIGINILIAILFFSLKQHNDKAQAFALASLILLLIGFSSCWGNLFLGRIIFSK